MYLPPGAGKDDDLNKLREILDDLLLKLCYMDPAHAYPLDRILVGDHKLANSPLKLINMDVKYSIFIPEFPLLHMRK